MLDELVLVAQQLLKQQQEKRPTLNPLNEVVEYYGHSYNNLVQLVCTKVANNLDENQLKLLRQGTEIREISSSGIRYPYLKTIRQGNRLDAANLSIQVNVWHYLYKTLASQCQAPEFKSKRFEVALAQRDVEIFVDTDLSSTTPIDKLTMRFIHPIIYIPSLTEPSNLKIFIKEPKNRQDLDWNTGVGTGYSNPAFIEKSMLIGITSASKPKAVSYAYPLKSKKTYLSEITNVNDIEEAKSSHQEIESLLNLSLKNYKMPSKDFIKLKVGNNPKPLKAARLHARGCIMLRSQVLLILADGDNKDVCLAPLLRPEDLAMGNITSYSNGYCIHEYHTPLANFVRFKKDKIGFIKYQTFSTWSNRRDTIMPSVKKELLAHLELSKLSSEALAL